MRALLIIATEFTYLLEPKYRKWVVGAKYEEFESKEYVNLIKDARALYDDLCEEFIDEVFENDSTLSRANWEKKVVRKCPYILSGHEIRIKIRAIVEESK